jgi:Fe-S cluster assembly iron-binding protein IscA
MVMHMKLHLTDLAMATLHLYLWKETNTYSLAIHVVLLTTGCNRPSFGLEITEPHKDMQNTCIQGIPFVWYPDEEEWLNGIVIDIKTDNRKFMIDHPNPTLLTNCFMEIKGDDQHVDNSLD